MVHLLHQKFLKVKNTGFSTLFGIEFQVQEFVS